MTLVMRLVVRLIALTLLAGAWRAPSASEQQAIKRAVRSSPSSAGVRERFLHFRISTVDRCYASVDTEWLDRHGNEVGRPSWLLRNGPTGWPRSPSGTDMPPCKTAPAAVCRDLFGSTICF
jgi:hypothetical protein